MQIESLPLADITLDPANVRQHDERNLEAIKGSLARFGQQKPVVVGRENVVIAGNGTVEAARALGWERIDAVRTALVGAEAVGYSLADNRSQDLSSFDMPSLNDLLGSLAEDGFDLEAIGWTDLDLKEIEKGLGNGRELIDPPAPEPPADPITQPGDLWTLGRHRLLCGDATKADDVGRLLDGRKPFIMVTDPPYGVEYKAAWRSEALKDGADRAEGQVSNDDRADWTRAWALFPGDVAYVWHSTLYTRDVAEHLCITGFELRSQLIWNKTRFAISRGHYHWKHEPCWYAVRKGCTARWGGDRSQSTIWDIAHVKNETGHGTQKPIECMARPIRNHGGKEDDVYDPFLGSGTTLIAAEQLDRTCHSLEISPAYCDVAIQRWESLTGETATRQ